ncbi:MAG: hypothetical protein QG656_1364, partial [Candidatus Hydrogenedentes bacterium]|nr:hypothetical protein [Candidatus Hydrogenedentota bacterium]
KQLAGTLEAKFRSSDIRKRCLDTPEATMRWVETQRFWCESMTRMFARLKADGRQVYAAQGRTDDFYTVANLGPVATVDGFNKRRVDGIDLARWARNADMQMFEEMQQPGMLESGVIFANTFGFRWAMAAGTRGGTLLYQSTDDVAADLSEAEVAAGGGGAFIQPGIGAPESRVRWRKFFRDHADLWDSGASWTKVGLLFWNDQVYYEHPAHLTMVQGLVRVLAETQVPFDIVTEEGLDTVGQYDTLIAPMLRYIDDAQIARLLDYAADGGRLAVVEPFGTDDKYARPRAADPLASIAATGSCAQHGKGQILRLRPKEVPARSSELHTLLEERANEFLLARDALNAARQAEIARGADLGAAFVSRIEQTFGLPLRWAPARTDPGVYLHAYRVPAKADRPERIVVHAVNYHIPIESAPKPSDPPGWASTRAGEPVAAENLRIAVPLPPGAQVERVEALSPTDTVQSVTWEMEPGRAILIVPSLRIYQALAINLKPCE